MDSSFNFNASSRTINNDDLNYSMNRTRALLSEIGNQPASGLLGSPSGARLFNKSVLAANTTLSGAGGHAFGGSFDQKESQSSIFTEFKLKSDSYLDEDLNLKELLKSYESICAEQVTFIRDQITNNYSQVARNKQTASELDDLEREKELWRLISTLYFDEASPASHRSNRTVMNDGTIGGNMSDDFDNENYLTMDAADDNDGSGSGSDLNYGVNEGLLIKHLERKNPLFRRVKLIISWLEKQSAQSEYMKSVREKISSFKEKSASWEHTLHHLKNLNKKMQFSSREYVTELDPDAPVRQNKPLNDLDQEDEYRIMEFVFAFVRSGDINGAKDLCFKVGQSWRAATLYGFKLFNDDNFLGRHSAAAAASHGKQDELKLNEGNMNRDVWKLMVSKMIKDEHFNKYEKALYASLAGIVGPVIPVCRTYMDFIWAYLKALSHQMIEREIKQKMPFREFVHLPYDSDEDNLFTNQITGSTIAQIFDRIAILINNTGLGMSGASAGTGSAGGYGMAMGNQSMSYSGANATSKEALYLKQDLQRPFSVVLKHIIQSGIDGFHSGTNELLEYLKTIVLSESQNGHLLRFSSHLALFYRSASLQIKNDLFVALSEKFVQYLIDHSYKQLVAYYLSHLPSQIQIKYYSKFLQGINENKERLLLLKLAKERNMDVQAITLNIVDNLSNQLGDDNSRARGSGGSQANKSMANMSTLGNRTDLLISSSTAARMIGGGGQQLNDEDKSRINALDWIVYDPLQRFKLLEYANLTMRYFLLARQNFEATKHVYSKIPHDTLTLILGQYNCSIEATLQQIIDSLPRNVSNAIKEYLCFKEYIEAINLYNEWFEHFYKEKPAKPVSSAAALNDGEQAGSGSSDPSQAATSNFAERIAMDYQLKQYEDVKARWYAKALQNCSRVKGKFFSVLRFPHGGWMCDSRAMSDDSTDSDDQEEAGAKNSNTAMGEDCISSDDDEDIEGDADMKCEDEDDENSSVAVVKKPRRFSRAEQHSTGGQHPNQTKERIGQLIELRKLYLPSIFFLLADMLNKMELFDEIIKLSDLIASSNYNLHTLFTSSQLKSILNKIADASTNLLDKNRDYLGY